MGILRTREAESTRSYAHTSLIEGEHYAQQAQPSFSMLFIEYFTRNFPPFCQQSLNLVNTMQDDVSHFFYLVRAHSQCCFTVFSQPIPGLVFTSAPLCAVWRAGLSGGVPHPYQPAASPTPRARPDHRPRHTAAAAANRR